MFANLLVAVITNSLSLVMQKAFNERSKTKCQLIKENEFTFLRDKIYKDIQYISVAKLEEVDSAQVILENERKKRHRQSGEANTFQ